MVAYKFCVLFHSRFSFITYSLHSLLDRSTSLPYFLHLLPVNLPYSSSCLHSLFLADFLRLFCLTSICSFCFFSFPLQYSPIFSFKIWTCIGTFVFPILSKSSSSISVLYGRIGRKTVLVYGCTALCIMGLIRSFTTSYYLLVVFEAVDGILVGSAYAPAFVLGEAPQTILPLLSSATWITLAVKSFTWVFGISNANLECYGQTFCPIFMFLVECLFWNYNLA